MGYIKIILFVLITFSTQLLSQVKPLLNAHAHNDYEHTFPLLDALDNGFTAVEADIYLIDGELYVAHDKPTKKDTTKTLRNLYLKPLQARIEANKGQVYANYTGFFYLMIDIKSHRDSTYWELKKQLMDYQRMISTVRGASEALDKPVKVFISGNRPSLKEILKDSIQTTALDGLPSDLGLGIPTSLMPVISTNYYNVLTWKGKSTVNPEEVQHLQQLIQKAHAEGKKVRLWGAPDTLPIWAFLLNQGVDLINTDKLPELKDFLLNDSNTFKPSSIQLPQEFAEAPDNLKINQIQVLGTHNSYAQPVDKNVMAYVSKAVQPMMEKMFDNMSPERKAEYNEYHPNRVPMSEALAYDHPPLTTQLNAGLRSLEIDVFYDPTGNRFKQPASYELMRKQGITDLAPFDTTGLGKPGFKVLHIADFDFRSHCPTLEGCLSDLKTWSDAHPDHVPVFILLEIKQQGLPIFPNPTAVLPFDSIAMDALDAEIVRVMGRNKIITPDDVRGNYSTLEKAVLAQNYPTVQASRGKFIFLMLPAIDESMAQFYWAGRPSLEGRMMFVRSIPGTPRAAFLLLDNALVRQNEIQERVKQGYLVRTRSDIETYEAKVNDYARADAAFKSGAQVISTDFFRPGNTYGTHYTVKMPNGKVARCNPVNGGCKQ